MSNHKYCDNEEIKQQCECLNYAREREESLNFWRQGNVLHNSCMCSKTYMPLIIRLKLTLATLTRLMAFLKSANRNKLV